MRPLLSLTSALVLSASFACAADVSISLTLATTPKNDDEIRMSGDDLTYPNPGYLAELLQGAGKRCQIDVKLTFMPWQRALLEVKNGGLDGAFSSSYTPERAAYAAYPLTSQGLPDRDRALKDYSYSLYTKKGAEPQWDGQSFQGGKPQKVAVERGASIIPRLEELGLAYVEIADNTTMLRMLANDRVPAAIMVTWAADAILVGSAELARTVTKNHPPIEEKVGYVVLSQHFQASHQQPAECFWNAARDIRGSAEHAARVAFYRDNK